jgi:hypothetical protein
MADRERRIQEIAYLLWEGEGRPDGQAERFWHMAEAAYEAEAELTGDKDETPSEEAATIFIEVHEVEAESAGEAESLAPAKPAPKAKAALADEDKPNFKPKAAKPKAGKAKADAAPAAVKAAEAEPAVKSAAKSKSKKS